MVCVDNPGGPPTVKNFPQIVCGSERWNAIMPYAVSATLGYAVAYLSFVIWCVWKVRARLTSTGGTERGRFQFVVVDYRDSTFQWVICVVAKDIILTCTPVIFPSDGAAQFLLNIFTVTFYAIATILAKPYKDLGALRYLQWGFQGSGTKHSTSTAQAQHEHSTSTAQAQHKHSTTGRSGPQIRQIFDSQTTKSIVFDS